MKKHSSLPGIGRFTFFLTFCCIIVLSFQNTCIAESSDLKPVDTWGKYLKIPDNRIPLNRFKGFYINTERPQKIIASETMDRINVRYSGKRFHGIDANDFGAYFAGRYIFKEDRDIMIQGSSHYSQIRIVINGRLFFDQKKFGSIKKTHAFKKGESKIEIEYINNSSIADLMLDISPPITEASREQARAFIQKMDSKNTAIWYVGARKAEFTGHRIDLSLKSSKKDVLLILNSFDPVQWFIQNPHHTRISAVIYGSKRPVSFIDPRSDLGAAEILKVADGEFKYYYYKLSSNWWPGVEDLSDKLSSILGNSRLSGFSGGFSPKPMVIPTISRP